MTVAEKYSLDNPPKIGKAVMYQGRAVEIQSAPSYALGTIRILDDLKGRIMVKIDELEEKIETMKVDGPCPFLLCLETGPHEHPICPECGAVRFGNLFCPRCRKEHKIVIPGIETTSDDASEE